MNAFQSNAFQSGAFQEPSVVPVVVTSQQGLIAPWVLPKQMPIHTMRPTYVSGPLRERKPRKRKNEEDIAAQVSRQVMARFEQIDEEEALFLLGVA